MSILPDTPVETAADGGFVVWIEVAGLAPGVYELSATVGDTVASANFTVLETQKAGVTAGGASPTPTAVPEVSAEHLFWVRDGVSSEERSALQRFYVIRDAHWSLAKAILELRWFQDGIQYPEAQVLGTLRVMAEVDPVTAQYALGLDWLADGLTVQELGRLQDLAHPAYEALKSGDGPLSSLTAAAQQPSQPSAQHALASRLAKYHPMLQKAVLDPAPPTAGDRSFLADNELSPSEIRALDRAQSVFGIHEFVRAWELETLRTNEVQALLHILTFYDPYTVVHDITADPDDPNAEGADLTRALDVFGVYPGSCVYCKGQRYYESGWYEGVDQDFTNAIGGNYLRGGSFYNKPAIFQRTKLLHLAHHATVQGDELSPCDLRGRSEEELLALGVIRMLPFIWAASYGPAAHTFMPSIRLTQDLLDSADRFPGSRGTRVRNPAHLRTGELLINAGEVLSPFTHAMRAVGGDFGGRGEEQCLNAVKAIVDWDQRRYTHFIGGPQETMSPLYEQLFPQNPAGAPVWATFLTDESGGQDKGMRLMDQFRALNLPALRHRHDIVTSRDDDILLIQDGPIVYFNPREIAGGPLPHHVQPGARDGVFLPTLDYFMHRNIGFGEIVFDDPNNLRRMGLGNRPVDITNFFHPVPEGCRLNRTGEPFQYGKGPALEYICPGVESPYVRLKPGPGPFSFREISAGHSHTCALEDNGGLVCWGSMKGADGLPQGGRFKAMSSGYHHVCVLHQDGTPECWGDDSARQSSPPSGEKLVSISAGLFHTCGVRENGAPVCWGMGYAANPPDGEIFSMVSAGRYATCGLRNEGNAICWGDANSQRGNDRFTYISTGYQRVCGLTQDGESKCWSASLHPASLPGHRFMAFDINQFATCGVTTGSNLVCFGEAPPNVEGSYKAVSVGFEHGCALRSDGTAECWGSDERGQASPPR